MIREGMAKVAGADLRYRLAGTQSGLPLLVFENGWGASYEYWAWVEQALAPHAELLFYDRAGIGGSEGVASQTVPALSRQFAELLSVLAVAEPVIVVGHSYGGLMCALHAAQQPDVVRALIELDPTPDQNDPVLDKQLKLVNVLARLAILCSRLGIPDPVFSPGAKKLPAPFGTQLVQRSFGSARSLRAAMAEMALLPDIRAVLTASLDTKPRLIASADKSAALSGLMKRLIPPERTRVIVERMQTQHRRCATRGTMSRWCALPYDHGGLVWSQAGAKDSAEKILGFEKTLRP